MHNRTEGCQAFREARRLYEKKSSKENASDESSLALAIRAAAACP